MNFHENGDGIELQYASDNVITGCEFVANTHAGIDAIGDDNTNNRITYCRFSQNEGYGLYLYGADETQIDHAVDHQWDDQHRRRQITEPQRDVEAELEALGHDRPLEREEDECERRKDHVGQD